MPFSIDQSQVTAWIQTTLDWVLVNATDIWILIQAAILVATYLTALALRRALQPLVGRLTLSWQQRPVLGQILRSARTVRKPLVFLLLLWVVIAIMQQATWPSRSYLLGVVASLMTAWIVIRLGSGFIHNPALAKALALGAWTVAALNILGLLDPTLALLDSLAMNFGELRVSLLTVIKGMLTLALLLWVATSLSRTLERRIRRVPDLTPSVQVLLGKLLKITLLTLAVVLALNSVGIDLTALAVLSGAIGLGIGFGLQKVVSNLISGVILLLDKSIKPGDVIELGPTFGWITSLGARYVSINTRDGKEYLIPNEDLITQRVVNWSFSNELVRLEVPIGVSYDSDPHQVRRLLRDSARKVERVVSEPAPVCHVVGFGDSSIDFILRFWISDPQNGVVNVKGLVLLAVWDSLKEHGISIPYPHRHLVMPDRLRVETLAAAE